MSGESGLEPVATREALLDVDPDLAEGLSEEAFELARERLRVVTVRVPVGAWQPRPAGAVPDNVLLVCDGLVVRELDLADTVAADLLGPGDLVSLHPHGNTMLAIGERWHAGQDAKVAILDARLLASVRDFPPILASLLARSARQAARAGEQRAISQLPRVDLRIRALLWYLAERWGRMGATGIVLPLELTHGALGALVGARRPTVTLALNALAREGAVVRREDGAWLLRADSLPGAPDAARSDDPVAVSRFRPDERSAESPQRLDRADAEALRLRLERVRVRTAAQRQRSAALLERSRAGRMRRESRQARASGRLLAQVFHQEDGAGDVAAVEAERHGDDAAGDSLAAPVDGVEDELDA